MRLIDADELKPLRGVAIYATDEKTDTKIITASVYRRADIDNAPTVEAIPVEWLEERLEHFHKLYDYAVADKNKYMTEVYSTAINELSELLDDWREVND